MTAYRHDPRVQWATNETFYLPDHDPDRWNLGSDWTIAFDGARWLAYTPDGDRSHVASRGPDFDGVLALLLGPPLWALQADMIRWAELNEGWLDGSGHSADGEPHTAGSVAGAAAIDNLQLAQVFREHVENHAVIGYILTPRGFLLADALKGAVGEIWDITHIGRCPSTVTLWERIRNEPVWADVEHLIVSNVPQTRAYGVTEPAHEEALV